MAGPPPRCRVHFFFQAEDGIRDVAVTGVQTCALPILRFIHEVKDAEIERLTVEYDETYAVAESLRPNGNQRKALQEAARIELGLRHFLLERDRKSVV